MTLPEVASAPISPDELTDEQVLAGLQTVSAIAARAFNWDGFCGLYYALWGYAPDFYQRPWYGASQSEWKRSRLGELAGILNEAGRGLHKSTFGFTFVLQLIGHFPHLSNVIVQATDDDTIPTSKLIAGCIENNSGWKAAFPNVVPDEKAGWSLNGYYVRDLTIDYGDWVRKVSHDHGRDPTLKMVSAASGSIGMHPTGVLDLDDIHNFKNTVSDVDMERIKNSIKSDVFGTMNRVGHKPMLMSNFTPKRDTDLNAELKAAGIFKHLFLPTLWYDENGVNEWEGAKVTLAHPKINLSALEGFKKIMGGKIFRSEHFLDLTANPEDELFYVSYPSESISRNWIVYPGCDPSDTEKDAANQTREQSHFALAYVAENPLGGAVIVDGILAQCSQAKGEEHIIRTYSLFPNVKDTLVEGVGYGRMWFNAGLRNPDLVKRIKKGDLKGYGFTDVHGGNKAARFHRELYPWIENGTVKISTANTPFLNALRKLLQEFKTIDKKDPAWDAWDAVYQSLKGMIHVLRVAAPKDGSLPSTQQKKKQPNPMSAMLRMNARGN